MIRATEALSDEDRKRVEQAIGEAERHSSAEIVCAVATESGRYDRAEGIAGIALAVAALGLAHGVHSWLTSSPGDFAVTPLHLGWQALAVVAGYVAGNVAASYVHPLRRLLVSEREMEQEVRRAASHVFALTSMACTSGRTGLLIYVSLFEHRIVVLADRAVEEALGQAEIEHLRDVAVEDLKAGAFTKTFVDVVREAEPRLAEKLPADRDIDDNELPNHLVTYHPGPSRAG